MSDNVYKRFSRHAASITGILTLLLLSISFPTVTLHAQSIPDGSTDAVVRELAGKGFENIRVARRNDTLFIGLENRVWRWQPHAAAEALKIVMPGVDSSGVVSLTLLRTGIPVTTVVVRRRDYDCLVAGAMPAAVFADSVTSGLSDAGYRMALAGLSSNNRSFFKSDVVVIPQLKVQFGNFIHPLEVQFNIAPAIQVTFLKGMTFTGQVIFPVFNNLIGDPEGNSIRPGLVTLSQTFRLPHQFFTTVTAGYFTHNRYGVNAEVRKFLFNGKMGLGATLGYTGRVQLTEGYFTYTPVNVFTWFCDASWRFARYDLTIRAGYGGFIDHDQGWRVDVSRQFGEVSIGFFAMQTGNVANGGFNFIIPLPPRKYGTKNHIRIRPPGYIPWEYRAKGLPSYGRTFSAGMETDDLMFNLNPDYVRRNLGREVLRP